MEYDFITINYEQKSLNHNMKSKNNKGKDALHLTTLAPKQTNLFQVKKLHI